MAVEQDSAVGYELLGDNRQSQILTRFAQCHDILQQSGNESYFGVYRACSDLFITDVIPGNNCSVPDTNKHYNRLSKEYKKIEIPLDFHTHPGKLLMPSNADKLRFLSDKEIRSMGIGGLNSKDELKITLIAKKNVKYSFFDWTKDYFSISFKELRYARKRDMHEACGSSFLQRLRRKFSTNYEVPFYQDLSIKAWRERQFTVHEITITEEELMSRKFSPQNLEQFTSLVDLQPLQTFEVDPTGLEPILFF